MHGIAGKNVAAMVPAARMAGVAADAEEGCAADAPAPEVRLLHALRERLLCADGSVFAYLLVQQSSGCKLS